MPTSALHSHPAPGPAQQTGTLTDLEAIQGVIDGNREMFEIIVRRYNPRLYRVGMAYLRNHTQVEDAMQNTYLKAFVKLKGFAGLAAFSTWLTRIMINECLMVIRTQKKFHTEAIDSDSLDSQCIAFEPPACESLNAKEMKALLEQSVKALPRTQRAVYLLREIQQLSTAETAACLGMSPENVKVSLHRAREGLKAHLLKTAASLELFGYSAAYCDPMTRKVMEAVLAIR